MAVLNKIVKRLTSNKGELLVETLISFLILSVLVGAVVGVLNSSMQSTGSSIQDGKILQEVEINPAVLSNYIASETATITFSGPGLSGASHQISFNTTHDLSDTNECVAAKGSVCTRHTTLRNISCVNCCDCNDTVAFSPN